MKKIISLGVLLCFLSPFKVLADSTVLAPTPALMSKLASQSLLTDITKLAGNKLVSVGDRGHIITSDDGTTWTQSASPVNVLLTDVFFLDNKTGWAVGHDVTIIKTVDGGKSWAVQHYSPKTDKPLFGIHFKDPNNGFAIGAYGLFLRTSDGGKSWSKEFHGEFLHPDDLDYINELKDTDPQGYEDETSSILPHFNRLIVVQNHAYLVGEVGLLAISTDYGHKWQKASEFYNGSFFDVALVEGMSDKGQAQGKRLYVGGLRGNFFASDLTGDIQMNESLVANSWQRIHVDFKSSINRILSVGNKLILMGNAGLLLVSEDGGRQFKSFMQADGKAITGGVEFNGKLVLTSQIGIKVIDGGQF